MLNEFISFIESEKLFSDTDRILLGVSGGIDSVVMLDLFAKGGFECGVAHCNFKLRGEEAEQDAVFVEQLAEHYGFPFHEAEFKTEEYAEKRGVSVQMAARSLRYEWFEQIRQRHSYNFVALAHHQDDIVETFHINLSRGTGIKGLSGIKPKKGNTVRPILFLFRDQINEYCQENQLSYREDSTNATVKYARNKIRHQVLPAMQKINPSYSHTIIKNIERLKEVEKIYNCTIEDKKKEICRHEHGKFFIDIEQLKALCSPGTFLFEFLQPYHFTPPVTHDILRSLDAQSGKHFFSNTHVLIKDRNELIVKEQSQEQSQSPHEFLIHAKEKKVAVKSGKQMQCYQIEEVPHTPGLQIKASPQVAYIDMDKLQFPLKIRHWQHGDFFYPLGMDSKKKISDFFIDNKISVEEKENIYLLTSGNDIVWVVANRIDDRYKIRPSTEQILKITVSTQDDCES